ncbi:hypothetical protein [Spirilliplanes yamanashiensis]|uniref:Uncharacterized protein n=1 Tax=Spirilliplanes yamanashiensis TaxID=42233 RepID=A0A8J3YES9_9ACTN|nr:hypothetical protein [Spirilliplanes yamanashiensis]MDP9818510.1 hypothetical protein [Spirilliplanes yamanashiensis]GIJ06362.1 hypothetical protein Sya03_57140 [Spirilliplanes yamanashiensis]
MALTDDRDAFNIAVGQGRALVHISAWQRESIAFGLYAARVEFDTNRQIALHVLNSSGEPSTFACQIDEIGSLLAADLGKQRANTERTVRPPAETEPFEMYSELLYDLGANADALVGYNPNVGPLQFAHVETDGQTRATVGILDTARKIHSIDYKWSELVNPIAGDLFGIVDLIAARIAKSESR